MSGGFGSTWWSEAWIDAAEAIAAGRTNRLRAGKRLARAQRAEDLDIRPGSVTAFIADGGDHFDASMRVRLLRDDEWDAVFEAIASRASHAAALLDGELDPGVVEDAAAVEVDLLPRPRDLQSVCSCPDETEPCPHAAATSYLFAQALDVDPFVLLLVRGRRRDEVLAGVRARRAGGATPDDGPDTASTAEGPALGMPWGEAWTRVPDDLPAVPPPPDRPGRPAPWPTDPPRHAAFDAAGLRALAEDAGARAWDVLAGSDEDGLGLDERVDLARRAAGASPTARARLAQRSDVHDADLEALGIAWQLGGGGAVRAIDEPRWTPPALVMAKARDLIAGSGLAEARRIKVGGNRISAASTWQFRLSRDGNWYVFNKDRGRWTLEAGPEPDVDDLLDLVLGT